MIAAVIVRFAGYQIVFHFSEWADKADFIAKFDLCLCFFSAHADINPDFVNLWIFLFSALDMRRNTADYTREISFCGMYYNRGSHYQTTVNSTALSNAEETVILNVSDSKADFINMSIQQQVSCAFFSLQYLTDQRVVYGASAWSKIFADCFCRSQGTIFTSSDAVCLTKRFEHLYCFHKNPLFLSVYEKPVLYKPVCHKTVIFPINPILSHFFSFFTSFHEKPFQIANPLQSCYNEKK
jgi:hypothetical protein